MSDDTNVYPNEPNPRASSSFSPHWAANTVTGLGRLAGRTGGVVAGDPMRARVAVSTCSAPRKCPASSGCATRSKGEYWQDGGYAEPHHVEAHGTEAQGEGQAGLALEDPYVWRVGTVW